jgi:oxygen-dependent protoporphyrinogen oxidase
VAVAQLSYKDWSGRPLDGFGGLIPSKEGRQSLGMLFMSSLFEGRCPEGGAQIAVFMGGIKRSQLPSLPEAQLQELAVNEARELLGAGMPQAAHIYVHQQAIPQYTAASGARFQELAQAEAQNKALVFASNARSGIGMADRIQDGMLAAENACRQIGAAWR